MYGEIVTSLSLKDAILLHFWVRFAVRASLKNTYIPLVAPDNSQIACQRSLANVGCVGRKAPIECMLP